MTSFSTPLLATLVDAVMAFTLAEIAALWLWHRFSHRGLQPGDYLPSLASGLLLMGALRCALTPGWLLGALPCLVASGLCHAVDLRLRWRRAREAQTPLR